MKIKHIIGTVILASVLYMGAFGQGASGRITGIAVDPSDPSGVIIIMINTALATL